jgi:uncharacterized Zn finger protein (UPF0148 family)
MNKEVNKFCSKCGSPLSSFKKKWKDGNYYCLFHEPTKLSEVTFQKQPFYNQFEEINFLIEFYKNLFWMSDNLEKSESNNKYETSVSIGDISVVREETLENITKKIKKLAKEIEERN